VRLLAGRFGPYVRHGSTNANLPRGADPEALTLDEAVALIAARQGMESKSKRKPRGASGAKVRTAAKAKARPASAKAKAKSKT
jgi:DNA topoisomerase-1